MENTKELKVRLTFMEPILGSAADPEVHERYIASNAPDALSKKEEIEALGVEEVIERGKTVFAKLPDGTPHLWDYQIRGFFKHACSMLKYVPGTESSKIKAFKKYIDGLVFIAERKIPIHTDAPIGNLQRPLRGQTAQGERIALANSETCEAGSWIEFTVSCLKPDLVAAVKEWLDYGKLNGLGQWHNGGFGRFTWKEA